MRLVDMIGSTTPPNPQEPGGRVARAESPRHRRTVDLTAWIGAKRAPALEPSSEPTWRREPLPPVRGAALVRAVAWVGQKRTPLVAGALSVAMVGVLVGSSFHSPVAAEALQRSSGTPVQQAVPASGPTPAVMSKPANSLARFAVVAGLPQVAQAVPGVSPGVPMSLAANAVPVAGASTSASGASSVSGAGEVSLATGSPAPAARPASDSSASPAPSVGPAPSPSPALPAVTVVAVPVVPLTAVEQTAADAAAAADLTAANALAAANLTKANALAAANLTAANAKAAADLTAANAVAAAAATAQAAADAAWAVAHP